MPFFPIGGIIAALRFRGGKLFGEDPVREEINKLGGIDQFEAAQVACFPEDVRRVVMHYEVETELISYLSDLEFVATSMGYKVENTPEGMRIVTPGPEYERLRHFDYVPLKGYMHLRK